MALPRSQHKNAAGALNPVPLSVAATECTRYAGASVTFCNPLSSPAYNCNLCATPFACIPTKSCPTLPDNGAGAMLFELAGKPGTPRCAMQRVVTCSDAADPTTCFQCDPVCQQALVGNGICALANATLPISTTTISPSVSPTSLAPTPQSTASSTSTTSSSSQPGLAQYRWPLIVGGAVVIAGLMVALAVLVTRRRRHKAASPGRSAPPLPPPLYRASDRKGSGSRSPSGGGGGGVSLHASEGVLLARAYQPPNGARATATNDTPGFTLMQDVSGGGNSDPSPLSRTTSVAEEIALAAASLERSLRASSVSTAITPPGYASPRPSRPNSGTSAPGHLFVVDARRQSDTSAVPAGETTPGSRHYLLAVPAPLATANSTSTVPSSRSIVISLDSSSDEGHRRPLDANAAPMDVDINDNIDNVSSAGSEGEHPRLHRRRPSAFEAAASALSLAPPPPASPPLPPLLAEHHPSLTSSMSRHTVIGSDGAGWPVDDVALLSEALRAHVRGAGDDGASLHDGASGESGESGSASILNALPAPPSPPDHARTIAE
ncbi:hypothetical protein BC828DRAFT_388867 [Blastocladiella britannica]|nr:hypothetical protein BC828DRAFT_388867 [Blastocladiella britannica]